MLTYDVTMWDIWSLVTCRTGSGRLVLSTVNTTHSSWTQLTDHGCHPCCVNTDKQRHVRWWTLAHRPDRHSIALSPKHNNGGRGVQTLRRLRDVRIGIQFCQIVTKLDKSGTFLRSAFSTVLKTDLKKSMNCTTWWKSGRTWAQFTTPVLELKSCDRDGDRLSGVLEKFEWL